MGPGHPECPERLDSIQDRLLISGVDLGLTPMEAPEAPIADIELAHDRAYIASLRGLSDLLIEDQAAGGPEYGHMDADTSINAYTWKAALCSAGAAISATSDEPTVPPPSTPMRTSEPSTPGRLPAAAARARSG